MFVSSFPWFVAPLLGIVCEVDSQGVDGMATVSGMSESEMTGWKAGPTYSTESRIVQREKKVATKGFTPLSVRGSIVT